MKNQEFRDTVAAVLGGKKRKGSGIYRSVKDGDLSSPIHLGEFLEGVGGVLRLPPKEPVKAPAPAQPRALGLNLSLPRYWRWLPIPVGALALATFALSRPAVEESLGTLPPQIFGIWTTSDPRYKNRNFEVSATFLTFKNGDRPDDQTAHPIQSVRTEERADTTVTTISYLDADAAYELALKYIPRPQPAIILSNQPEMVWRRAPAPAPSR
jgi:hypothetical protein